jgi:hypothetical protein
MQDQRQAKLLQGFPAGRPHLLGNVYILWGPRVVVDKLRGGLRTSLKSATRTT